MLLNERTRYQMRNVPHRFIRGWKEELANALNLPTLRTELRATVLRAGILRSLAREHGYRDIIALLDYQDTLPSGEHRNRIAEELHARTRSRPKLRAALVDLGVLGRRSITTAGASYIVDAFQNTTEVENFNYHDSGTNSTAEAIGDTDLGTKVETGRTTGTQSEPSATVYKTTGTIAYTTTRTMREHGVFSASSSGTLLDRTVYAAIGVDNGDSIQFGYSLTIATGG